MQKYGRVRVLVGGHRKYNGKVEANLALTHRILQAAERAASARYLKTR